MVGVKKTHNNDDSVFQCITESRVTLSFIVLSDLLGSNYQTLQVKGTSVQANNEVHKTMSYNSTHGTIN
jgi:hypothetical protein